MVSPWGALRPHLIRHVADDLQIDAEEIIARHTRLTRHARGHDDDVGTRAVVPVGRSDDAGVVAQDGAHLLQIERLALGQSFLLGNVEQHHVAELVTRRDGRQLAANVARPDECDLVPLGHVNLLYEPRFSMMSDPNSEHATSRAPSISRAKS
jgi:hypothetical protein